MSGWTRCTLLSMVNRSVLWGMAFVGQTTVSAQWPTPLQEESRISTPFYEDTECSQSVSTAYLKQEERNMATKAVKELPLEDFILPRTRSCAACGLMLTYRHALKALDKGKTIAAVPASA